MIIPKNFSAPELSWQVVLKNTKVIIDLLTDIGMSLMVEKGIRGCICHCIYQYAQTNNKYMKDYVKNKESTQFTSIYSILLNLMKIRKKSRKAFS